MRNDSASWIWFALIAVVGVLLYKGVFYQTGAQWHEACWYAQHSEKGPKTPQEAAEWSQCGVSANRVFYKLGMMSTYRKPITPAMQAVDKVCPSNQFSIVNLSSVAVETITAKGGPDIWDKLLPATWALEKVFKKSWPNCAAARAANNFPLMVEQNNSGWFDWASNCVPCEAEDKAYANPPSAPAPGPYTLLDPAENQPTAARVPQ